MGLDIASVTLNHLPRPSGHAYEFAKWLLSETSDFYGGCHGEGNSFGYLYRQSLLCETKRFCNKNNLGEEAEKEVKEWIESLPWDKEKIILYFDW